mmetsp:Transcript_46170/g.93195  ORF Transcript_46170/g.93195 Transcript_46170/m.93195 type:complete len:285 (+) Transcript_46170:245-1099(+)
MINAAKTTIKVILQNASVVSMAVAAAAMKLKRFISKKRSVGGMQRLIVAHPAPSPCSGTCTTSACLWILSTFPLLLHLRPPSIQTCLLRLLHLFLCFVAAHHLRYVARSKQLRYHCCLHILFRRRLLILAIATITVELLAGVLTFCSNLLRRTCFLVALGKKTKLTTLLAAAAESTAAAVWISLITSLHDCSSNVNPRNELIPTTISPNSPLNEHWKATTRLLCLVMLLPNGSLANPSKMAGKIIKGNSWRSVHVTAAAMTRTSTTTSTITETQTKNVFAFNRQ